MKTLKLIPLVLLSLVLTGCHIEHHHPITDVEVHWIFEGLGCRDAEVREVEVFLEDRHGRIYDSGPIPCREGSYVFLDVVPGTHLISAYAYPSSFAVHPTWGLQRSVKIRRGFNDLTLDLEMVW